MKVKTVDAEWAHQMIRRQLLRSEKGQLWTLMRAVGPRALAVRLLALSSSHW